MTKNAIKAMHILCRRVLRKVHWSYIEVIANQKNAFEVCEILKAQGFDTDSQQNLWLTRELINDDELELFSIALIENSHERRKEAFQYFIKNKSFFNISSVEKECGIKRTTLTNALNRKQDSFRDSDKLVDFLDSNFLGWDIEG